MATWAYSASLQFLVAEQYLNHPDIHLLFQQMRGKAVPQRMHRYPRVYPRRLCGRMDGTVELPRAERVDGVHARE